MWRRMRKAERDGPIPPASQEVGSLGLASVGARLTAAVVVAASGLGAASCLSVSEQGSCGGLTTPTAPAFGAPLQGTADAIALGVYATRSAVEVSAAEAQAQATVQAVIHQATAQAAQVELEQQRLLATRQAAQLTAQAQATADAFSLQMTTEALHVEATATERAYQATATADVLDRRATATAVGAAAQATATRAAWEGRTTATAESVHATQVAHQATATRAAESREEVLAVGRDFGVPLILLVLLVGLIWLVVFAVRQIARRPVVIQRGPLGDAPLLAHPIAGGGWNVIDPDRQPGHVTRLLADGSVQAPQLRSAGQEERTTARDQQLDAATRPRLGAGQTRAAASTMPMAPPPQPPAPGLRQVAVIRRLDQAGTAGFLPPPLVAALQADWEEGD